MNPDTGKLKWYYQFTPHDVHSYDATEPNVLVDTRYRGQDRKLMLHADRNGFFYVLDRTNGQILLATTFINRLTWASGIGADGRLQLLPDQDVTCPEAAANWNASAFSPVTRLYYVMAVEDCSIKLSPGSWKTQHAPVEPSKKYLRALDIESGKIVWENPQIGEAEGKSKKVLKEFVSEQTGMGLKRLMTDDNPGYQGATPLGTIHQSVNHSADEWVRGDVHTNSVENVWSLFKRSVIGAYHQVSKKHLDAYLDEFEWRFNNRDNPFMFRDTLVKLLSSKNLEYKELIEKSA
jgi:hypothetical protein